MRSTYGALQERGKQAMGVDQYTSAHHLDDLTDGGRIELRRDVDDAAGVAQIRAHLQGIASAFTDGDFTTPAFVHLQFVPGASVMVAKRAAIRYTLTALPHGGQLLMASKDKDAIAAIHEFMAFQRMDHRTPKGEIVVSVTITQLHDYQFLVDFGAAIPSLQTDEPPPLGAGEGPSPSALLLATVANCLLASLLFALRKFKQDAGGIRATATARIDRNEEKRLRVQEITVAINLGSAAADIESLDRILAQFEEFCTVSQSVRQGIPIVVTVEDGAGVRVK